MGKVGQGHIQINIRDEDKVKYDDVVCNCAELRVVSSKTCSIN